MTWTRAYLHGMGQQAGDPLNRGGQVYLTGVVRYVSATNGDDANAPGTNYVKPLRTLTAALALANAGDIVSLDASFSEMLFVPTQVPDGVTVIGGGLLGGCPSSEVSFTQPDSQLLMGNFSQLRNVWVRPRIEAVATVAKVEAFIADDRPLGIRFIGVLFDSSHLDREETVLINGDAHRFERCYFRAVEPGGILPATGLKFMDPGTHFELLDTVFDRGETGWGSEALSAGSQTESLRFEGLTLMRNTASFCDADSGWVHVPGGSGSAFFPWEVQAGRMQRAYRDGAGMPKGDRLLTGGPVITTGRYLYVSSVRGDDANDGQQLRRPFKTLLAALDARESAEDIIVLDHGHVEVFVDTVVLSSEVAIFGAGGENGEPTARFEFSGPDAQLRIEEDTIQIRNVVIAPRDTETTEPRVVVDLSEASSVQFHDVLFECGEHDRGPGLQVLGKVSDDGLIDSFLARRCTFRSVAPTPSVAPSRALETRRGILLEFQDITLDGGESGFDEAAFVVTEQPIYLRVENLTMLRGADMSVPEPASCSYIHVSASSESNYIEFGGSGG